MKKREPRPGQKKHPPWDLRLYIASPSPRCLLAIANLKSLCEQYLPGQYRLTVVDLMKEPERAQKEQIVATPAVVRVSPEPQRMLIGSLRDTDYVLRALDLDREREKISTLLERSSSKVGNA